MSFVDTGLRDGTTYRYRITVTDHAGNEYLTSTPTATITGTPRDTTPPPAPENLSAQSGEDSRVDLTWSPIASDPRLDHYDVFRQNPDGSWPSSPTSTTTSMSFGDTTTEDGTAYTYRVAAVDLAGSEYVESSPSAPATATPRAAPPAPPEELFAQAGVGHVSLTWAATTDARLDHYDVYRESENGTWPTSPIAEPDSASFIDGGATSGIADVYRVTAIDHAGNEYVQSAPSATAMATPTTAPTPEGLTAGIGQDGETELTWTAVTDANLDHYAITARTPTAPGPKIPQGPRRHRPSSITNSLTERRTPTASSPSTASAANTSIIPLGDGLGHAKGGRARRTGRVDRRER